MTSQLTRALTAAATDLLRGRIEEQRLPTEVAYAVAVFERRLIAEFGGARLEVPRQMTSSSRGQRHDRIRQALERGESLQQIARREGVSTRWVRTLRRA